MWCWRAGKSCSAFRVCVLRDVACVGSCGCEMCSRGCVSGSVSSWWCCFLCSFRCFFFLHCLFIFPNFHHFPIFSFSPSFPCPCAFDLQPWLWASVSQPPHQPSGWSKRWSLWWRQWLRERIFHEDYLRTIGGKTKRSWKQTQDTFYFQQVWKIQRKVCNVTAKMEIRRQKEFVSYDSMTRETRTDVDIEEIKKGWRREGVGDELACSTWWNARELKTNTSAWENKVK